MSPQVELALLLVAVAAACAVPGTFLVLRRMALVSDAISHVLLFGIVVAYLAVRDVSSPWLFLGAAASGVLTVALVELLQRTKLVKEDAAIGLVFPALFSLGALLLSLNVAKGIHLDVDQVLLGNEVFSISQDRLTWAGRDVAPRGLVVMAGLFVLNAGLVAAFYKELKLSTFDAGLAATLGFAPALLHYGLMTAVSVTAVAAFDSVGPVVVVALFVVPPAAAYLLTDRLSWLLVLAVGIGVVGAVVGVLAALALDANVAGTVATTLGGLFGLAFVFAPGRGLVAQAVRRWRQKRRFHETMLAIHLLQHEGTPQEADESRLDGLHRHLHWRPAEVTAVTARAARHGLVTADAERLRLTPAGREVANEALGRAT
jgi:manganese/zinc/iron transport system permease protein